MLAYRAISDGRIKMKEVKTTLSFIEALEHLINYATMDNEFDELEEYVLENEENDDHITVAAAVGAEVLRKFKVLELFEEKMEVIQKFKEGEGFLEYVDSEVKRIKE